MFTGSPPAPSATGTALHGAYYRARLFALEHRALFMGLLGAAAGAACSYLAHSLGSTGGLNLLTALLGSALVVSLVVSPSLRRGAALVCRCVTIWLSCLGVCALAALLFAQLYGTSCGDCGTWQPPELPLSTAPSIPAPPATVAQPQDPVTAAINGIVSMGTMLSVMCFLAMAFRGSQGVPLSAAMRRFLDSRGPQVTARHEAGHALVGAVLGVPFLFAFARWDRREDFRGAVECHALVPDNEAGATGRAMRKVIAFLLAGALAERKWETTQAALQTLSYFQDWGKATILAGILSRDGKPLDLEPICEKLRVALDAPAWQAAIGEAHRVLLLAGGNPVPAPVFEEIAARHKLTLPVADLLEV